VLPPAAPRAAQPHITIERPPRARVPRRPAGDPGPAPGGPPALWALLALILVAGAVLMVLLAAGVFSAQPARTAPPPPRRAQAAPPPRAKVSTTATVPAAPQPPAAARAAVLGLVQSYATAFSAHDLAGLTRIFAPGIVRRGLVGASCAVSVGRPAVLADYAGQFQSGTGRYTLPGLGPPLVQLNGDTAVVPAHYAISTGGAGSITFTASRATGSWQIVRVDATCG
jgi:hypothetical protein